MSIQQTRQGFTFQDYIAIEVFLRRYLEGNLREYYIDYLYDEEHGLSHDIRYVVEENGSKVEQCIEVKTGDRFNSERDLIGKALCEIYNYLKANQSATYRLYISKDFEGSIATCWEALRLLKRGIPMTRISALQAGRMTYLRELPHIDELVITDDELQDYLSRLDIESPTLSIEFSLTHTKGLETIIAGLIHELGSSILLIQLDVPRNQLALPHQLTQELVYITSVYAGSNVNVLPLFRKAIARYFSYASEVFQPDIPHIQSAQNDYERQLKEFEGLQEVPTVESITESTELGVPS